jgi:alpha/beta superfamily hydrolase
MPMPWASIPGPNASSAWAATKIEVVADADHFFLGRSGLVTAAAVEFVNQVAATS